MVVSEVIDDVRDVLGQVNNDLLFRKLTEAVEVLANKGHYDLHIGYVDILAMTDGRTLTLPRGIDTPMAVNVGGRPSMMRSKWFEFHMNGPGSMSGTTWTWDDSGFFPIAMDIITASNLIAIADLKTDLNATIRVYGYDVNGAWIRTQAPDGTWQDGFLVPINIFSDFPSGLITPDINRIFERYFSTSPMFKITSATPHQFVSGQQATIALVTSPMPTPLKNGASYYIGVIDSNNISLYGTQTGALTNTGAIILSSASALSQVSLTDTRQVSTLTEFNSATHHNMSSGQVVSFTAGTMPNPLISGTNYYAHVIDANNFTVHATVDEANNNVNPIDCTSPGATITANAKSPMKPITQLNFVVNHDFSQGDAVTVQNPTGIFPTPLLPSTTYFVRYINSKAITLHPTLSDATNNTNPIILTDGGSGGTSVVKLIACSVSLGTTNNVTAVNHGLSLQGGDFVQFSTSGSYPSPLAQNTTYRADTPSSKDTFTVRSTAPAPINILTPGTGQLYLVISRVFTVGFTNEWSVDASSLSNGNVMQFSTTGALPACNPLILQNTNYYARVITTEKVKIFDTQARSNDTTVRLVSTRARASNVATIVFTANHGLSTNDYIDVSGLEATKANSAIGLTITAAGTGYTNKSTVTFQDGSGNQGTAYITTSAGAIQTINVQDGGQGFTNGASVNILGGGGNATATINGVQTLTGFIPTITGIALALTLGGATGTGYVAGTVTCNDTNGNTLTATITVSGGVIQTITLTNGGQGFTDGATVYIQGGNNNATATINGVYATVGLDITQSNFDGLRKQVTVTNATTVTFASSGLGVATVSDTNGAASVSSVDVTAFGAIDLYFVLQNTVNVQPFSSIMAISTPQFLQDGATIQFTTNGTLPAPLTTGTNYQGTISNGGLQISSSIGIPITLTNVGSGVHTMVMTRNFGTTIPTSLVVAKNNYNNGDAVTIKTTGVLPVGLDSVTTYYLRRLDDNTVELYDTAAHATDTSNTTGRYTFSNTGSGVHSLLQTLSNFQVLKIDRVSKSQTDGNIKLIAWDTGRASFLTVLGDYYPDETEPMYRRIKVGSACSWIRMRYRKSIFKLASMNDFIPLKSKTAILLTLQALQLFKTEFNESAEKLMDQAVKFMNDAQKSADGPVTNFIQVNDKIFTGSAMQVMDTEMTDW